MELLKEIKDKEFPKDQSGLKIREASRAILFDENGLVPLLFVSKHNFHKIPGGGINDNENKKQALMRECFEEIGCDIKIEGELGKIVEFRSKWNLKQISYCYYGKIISKGEPNFTEKELDSGFKVIWLSLEDAIFKIENDDVKNYPGIFVKKRDLEFLKKVKEVFQNS